MYLRPEIEKKIQNFYLFKQNMQAQMQAIFESKTRCFPEFGQTDRKTFLVESYSYLFINFSEFPADFL